MGDEAKLIDPSGIPHFIGDLDTLDTDVMLLTANADQFRASGSDVHTTFQHLSAFYSAPEAEQLFSTTLPVQQKSDAFAEGLEKVAGVLSDYGIEVEPLARKLDSLKAEATAFVNSVSGDDDWRKDSHKVDHNNDLWHDVNHTVAAFQAAERRAYNKIMALIGGTPLTADDGTHGKNMYGFDAADLDQATQTPWGAPAEREYEGWRWLVHQGKQVWDGVWQDGVMGTVHGLGTLVGWDGWDAAGQAWENLAKLGTGIVMTIGTLGTWAWVSDKDLPSWLRESRHVLNQTGKGLVAWDQWKTNPGRAAGALGFNVLTIVGTDGIGAAASGTGKAGAAVRTASVAGKIGRVIDPMTYVGKAGKFTFVKVGGSFTALKNLRAGATTDLLKQADALRSPKIPATAVPYVDKTTGKVVYLTDEGHVLNADGSLRQHVSQAKTEGSAGARAAHDPVAHSSAAGSRIPEFAGAHGGDGFPVPAERGVGGTASRLPEDSGVGGASGHAVGDTPGVGSRTGRYETPRDVPDPVHHSGGHEAGTGHDGPGSPAEPPAGSPPHESPGGHPADAGHGDAPGDAAPDTSGQGHPHAGTPDGPPDIDPAKYTRNTQDLAHAHTGGMKPEQEAGVLEELSRAKLPVPDQQKVLRALGKDPYGAGVAEMISRGHLRDVEGYRKLLDMCKQGPTKADPKGMVPAVHMAMRVVTDLQERGVGRVGVELDTETFDLDAYTRHADGSVDYGYQLKDVTNIQGIKSAAVKAAKQLKPPGIDHRVAILDVHQPMADLTPRMFREAEFQAERMGGSFLLRFTDGSLTIPPGSPTFP
ncbi:hypothetical protein FRZ03_32605 [Streptomyces misionensis]|uniref:Uncharacterized protein n=1 Tax=Streptomyces misionensis TaxID=67331 RepID=A0A5C6IUC3_9ACTN|nr:hypothetical protein [Streptomyces misionensis]TWV32708.1 hypothetical protein FRZ03_32605 [Streptomyces misionensis]